MSANNTKVTVNYTGDSEKHTSHNIGISKDYIAERLSECYSQNKIQIEEIIVRISYLENHDEPYTIEISIVSPDIDFNYKNSNKDYSASVHSAIDKTLEFVHKQKDKFA